MFTSAAQPAPQGLYDGRHEHDACGVAFVATLTGVPSHDIVDKALTALRNLEHRGASGAEPDSGDGAGILFQVPDRYFREVVELRPAGGRPLRGGHRLPPGRRGRGRRRARRRAAIAAQEGLRVLGWREVPTDPSLVGATARSVMPSFWQLFVAAERGDVAGLELDRRAFPLRKRVEHELGVYFASLSARTIVYKGMLTTGQLEPFYPELSDPRLESALALVHSRFSTNTFPSWPLAHPYRYISHNGEINTVRGNRNWMQAREAMLTSKVVSGDITRLFPICTPGGSDSASFDEVLELLHLAGRSLPHSVLMMIPEAWENNPSMDPARRAFYEFHANFMEPWDGPANVCFTDGTQIGAVLDRNGLRPGRFWVTDRRTRRAGIRGGRPRHRPRVDRAQGPAPARPHVPRGHGGRPHHRGRRGQGAARGGVPVRGVAAGGPHPPRVAAGARAHRAHARSPSRAASRPSATRRRSCASSSSRWLARARSRSARWAPTRRSPCCRRGRG